MDRVWVSTVQLLLLSCLYGLAGSSSGVSSSATAGSISGSSGSLSEKNNMLGNFARWNEPPSPSQTTRTSIGFPSKKGHQGQDAAVSGESDTTDPTRLLHIQVYRALTDAVVLDWTISLADKDRMKSCSVNYSSVDGNENHVIVDFMPKTRTFLLKNLTSDQTYTFHMSCEENQRGIQYSSGLLRFRTTSSLSLSNPSSSSVVTNFDSPGSTNYLNEMDPLPAISSSIVRQEEDGGGQSASPTSISVAGGNGGVQRPGRSSGHNAKISPHAVLGASCAVVGFIIIGITVGLAMRRYNQYRKSQTRLWELQTVQDLESPTMPTFINLPPPYSEQPSPLYNLCTSSSISSTTTISCCQLTSAAAEHSGHQPPVPVRSCCHVGLHQMQQQQPPQAPPALPPPPQSGICIRGGTCPNESVNHHNNSDLLLGNYFYSAPGGSSQDFNGQNSESRFCSTSAVEGASASGGPAAEPNNNNINFNNNGDSSINETHQTME